MDRVLNQMRTEMGALKSRLEARQIRDANEQPQPIDYNDLLPLVGAVDFLLERIAKTEGN